MSTLTAALKTSVSATANEEKIIEALRAVYICGKHGCSLPCHVMAEEKEELLLMLVRFERIEKAAQNLLDSLSADGRLTHHGADAMKMLQAIIRGPHALRSTTP